MVWCAFPTLSCVIAELPYQLMHAPLTVAVGGLLSVSELLWALTLFLHYHLGMKQSKASGNLDFIDISQRSSQAPSAFLGWSAAPPPAFVVAVPALTMAPIAALQWGSCISL